CRRRPAVTQAPAIGRRLKEPLGRHALSIRNPAFQRPSNALPTASNALCVPTPYNPRALEQGQRGLEPAAPVQPPWMCPIRLSGTITTQPYRTRVQAVPVLS